MTTESTLGTYNPEDIEQKWYNFWEKNRLFHAEPLNEGEAYSIVIPPPNVTGSLHMGHALNNTLQDILIRYKQVVVPELNGGQLAFVLRAKYALDIQSFPKLHARPFRINEIKARIDEILGE